jgi:hypothetical protein
LERLALWQQKWHLVTRMRNLRNDYSEPSVHCVKYGQTFPSGAIRFLPKDSDTIQLGFKRHSKNTLISKP